MAKDFKKVAEEAVEKLQQIKDELIGCDEDKFENALANLDDAIEALNSDEEEEEDGEE